MDDLINRKYAIKTLLDEGLITAAVYIERMPSADLFEYSDKLWKIAYERGKKEASPKKGNWVCEIRHYKGTAGEFDYQYIYCSECGEQRRIGWRDANYCPNCGARMEE